MHESEVPHAIVWEERRSLVEQELEDFWMGECVTQYPVQEKLVSELESEQAVLWVHDGPEERGHGITRTRLLDVGVNLRTMRFVGPKA